MCLGICTSIASMCFGDLYCYCVKKLNTIAACSINHWQMYIAVRDKMFNTNLIILIAFALGRYRRSTSGVQSSWLCLLI